MSVVYWSVCLGKCIMVFLLVAAVEINAELFSVTRGLLRDGSNILEDVFKLPSSLCNTDPECSRFGGNVRSDPKCLCECPREKATFVAINGELRCTQNALIRNRAGCNYKFHRASETSDQKAPLEVVSDHYFKYLSPLRKVSQWSCQIVPSSSVYQDCDGNWVPSHNGWGLFNISVLTGASYFRFELNADPTNSYAHFKGKIIKLSVRCAKPGGYVNESCLLFKVKGTINCTWILPKMSTMPTSSAVTTNIDRSTTMKITTEFKEETNTPAITDAASNGPTSNSLSTLSLMDNASLIMQRSSPTAAIPTTTEEEIHGGGVATTEGIITESMVKVVQTSDSSSPVYIAVGSVLAAAVVVLSVLLVIACRRNSNKFSCVTCWKPPVGKDQNTCQSNVQMTAVYDDMNYMMPVERFPDASKVGRRKGFANPTYERGRDNTVKIRTTQTGGNPHRDPSIPYTDADFLSVPLPPIPSNSLAVPGPSSDLRQNISEEYEFRATQSEEDKMYQSVDNFSTKNKGVGTSGQNLSKPGFCSPYHSSSIFSEPNRSLDTKKESVKENIQENSLPSNSLKFDPPEGTYQALNSPPASPVSSNGEYQPLMKTPSEQQHDSIA